MFSEPFQPTIKVPPYSCVASLFPNFYAALTCTMPATLVVVFNQDVTYCNQLLFFVHSAATVLHVGVKLTQGHFSMIASPARDPRE